MLSDCDPGKESSSYVVLEGDYAGEKALVSGGDVVWLSEEDGFLARHREELTANRETGILELGGVQVYAERIGQESKVVICGCGHVSVAIIKIARLIGCSITAIDDRPAFTENAKAAGADRVICDEFEKALAGIPGGSDTYFIIVTRGHQWDSECLRAVLKKPHAYIGMMGSKRRVRIVMQNMIEEGFDRELVESVHSPIGLKIGSETPEEIAVSIMAEIIEVKSKRRSIIYPRELTHAILGAEGLESEKSRMILATIVARKGSAPREVGSKMILTDDGRMIGTIGGGCTEADVIRRSAEMFAAGDIQPVLMDADLTADEAAQEGEVCGGVIRVYLEEIR